MKKFLVLSLVFFIILFSCANQKNEKINLNNGLGDVSSTVINNEVRIPAVELNNITTPDLLQQVLEYPYLPDIAAFNTFEEGLEALAKRSDAITELLNRNDVSSTLLQYYKTMQLTKDSYPDKNNQIPQFLFVELLLSRPEIIARLSAAEKTELITESYNKFSVKNQNAEIYGYIALVPCAAVMKRTLEAVNYYSSNATRALTTEVNGSYAGIDKENIDELLIDVKSFLNK